MRAVALILAVLAVSPSGALAATPRDPDFEPEEPVHSLALGPAPSGTPVVSMDVGWLWSGLRLDLGITSLVGLILSADTMLLYRGFDSNTGVHFGVRLTPITGGAFRLSIEGTAGQIFIPMSIGSETLTQIRGDVIFGTTIDPVTVYGRFGLIGEKGSDVPGRPSFLGQEQLGAGVETAWRRYVFGAEAYVWARPGHSGIGQWRLRAGIVL
ncbi:hypothetical protein [Anaeromyxobacter oryzae]|uniref:Outer membrane protein beta-barrel domain-containing protein n=1 Tax=Anaeromyxobacter oryzae TaxID=2918170 RepID=A0ABN6MR07_9BACT|nr:hypothetical protein [Anaeromyxobacter oryzae]BDG03365.1 hypothetical protein AMOR_23610 [Anaeromyxobacter oryzae]